MHRQLHALRSDMHSTYLYTRLINPVLTERLLPDSAEARHHAQVVYHVFRTKACTLEAERSYRTLLNLLNIGTLDQLPGPQSN